MISDEKDSPSPELLFQTNSGEKIIRKDNSVIVRLPPRRNVIATSYVNGGYTEDLEAVFNHQPEQTDAHSCHNLEGGSVEAYIRLTAGRLGLNPDKIAAMMTAASMKNVAIVSESYRALEVTAIVTAGIEVNGGRAGDPASVYEEGGKTEFLGGTINTILILNAHVPEHALARAIMTAAEAKTVAIQQLMAPSRYSTGIATGSGTDQICVISDMSSKNLLTYTGKHAKLGELIGKTIITATTEALSKQTELNADSQRDMLVRLDRFRIGEDDIWKVASTFGGANKKPGFIDELRFFSKDPSVVAMIAALLHITDEISWGLIPEASGRKTAISMMKTLPTLLGESEVSIPEYVIDDTRGIIDNWIRVISWYLKLKTGVFL